MFSTYYVFYIMVVNKMYKVSMEPLYMYTIDFISFYLVIFYWLYYCYHLMLLHYLAPIDTFQLNPNYLLNIALVVNILLANKFSLASAMLARGGLLY